MAAHSKVTGFEWDRWNTEKSYLKHDVTTKEAEELFLGERVLLLEDLKHSQKEERYTGIGKIAQGTILFASFTVRNSKIRIISVRKANKKERSLYDEKA